MWRYGTALAEDGWYAVAVDLRGHGRAPRALDYTIAAYAEDVAATRPPSGSWDLVVGHSLGGAAAVRASADHPDWTARLVLIDPALLLLPEDREIVRGSQEAAFADTTVDAVRAAHPRWHPQDIELKATAAQQASVWAVTQTSEQNAEWDEREAAARLTVPTHVIGADPAVYSLFTGATAAGVRASNDRITMSVVEKAGHSPHRDRPEATVAAFRAALA